MVIKTKKGMFNNRIVICASVYMHQLELIENDVVIRCQMYIEYNMMIWKILFFLFLWYKCLHFLLHSTSPKKSLSLSLSLFAFVTRIGRTVELRIHSLHIHFWLILFFLSCSNGHAISNRKKNRRVKWFEHVKTSVGM
jgi:hypothetical protein